MVYLLSFSGKDRNILKGVFTGVFGFGLFRGVLANVGPGKTYPKDAVTNALMSLGSFLWGVSAGYMVTRLGDERLFKPNTGVLSNPAQWSTYEEGIISPINTESPNKNRKYIQRGSL